MNNYQKFGFVNTKQMFKDALKGHYAIPQYNFNIHIEVEAIIASCVETRSPVIIAVGSLERIASNPRMLLCMAHSGVEYARDLERNIKSHIPIAFHLDHAKDVDTCKSCVDEGYSSVMIDASDKSLDKNIKLTKEVVDYAHKFDVSVEGELGLIAGIEDATRSDRDIYTHPEDVEDFVARTGVDSLAISIGTSHGAYKFKIKPGESPPPLRIDILKAIRARVPNFPLVLHGASSIPQDAVKTINEYGGKVENAVGIAESDIKKAALDIVKVNVHTDSKLVFTAALRKFLHEHPSEFNPRSQMEAVKNELMNLYKNKNTNVLLCGNRV
jgi:fructose-bisphosphate aldolase class II